MKDYNYILFNITAISIGMDYVLQGYNVLGTILLLIMLNTQIYRTYKLIDIKTLLITVLLIIINLVLVYKYANNYISYSLVLVVSISSINLGLWFNKLLYSSNQNIIEMNKSVRIIFIIMLIFIMFILVLKLNYKLPIFILYVSLLATIIIEVKLISLLRIYKYYNNMIK